MKTISNQDADTLVRALPLLRAMHLNNLADENTRRRAVLALRRLERKLNLKDDTIMANINDNAAQSASQTKTPLTRKLLDVACEVSGYSAADVLSGCRKRPLPAVRYIVGDALMRAGYSSVMAARELGINHATLLHGRKQMQDWKLTRAYDVEQNIKDVFNEQIQDVWKSMVKRQN